jgi:hypothetical protein
VEQLIIGAVVLTIPALFGTLWMIWKIGRWWQDRFGRLVFGSLAILVLWAASFLSWVALVAAFRPYISVQVRQLASLFFACSLLLGTLAVAYGLWRYRYRWPRLPRDKDGGGIP